MEKLLTQPRWHVPGMGHSEPLRDNGDHPFTQWKLAGSRHSRDMSRDTSRRIPTN